MWGGPWCRASRRGADAIHKAIRIVLPPSSNVVPYSHPLLVTGITPQAELRRISHSVLDHQILFKPNSLHRSFLKGSLIVDHGSLEESIVPARLQITSAQQLLSAHSFSSSGLVLNVPQKREESKPKNESPHENHQPPVTWADRYMPTAVVPYIKLMRLDTPVGAWLLAWPCFWSIALAAPSGQLPDPFYLALFGSGAVLLRGAGCTINDYWDRDFDKQVTRTRMRPIASGAVSPNEALSFLTAQLLLGLNILLQLNWYSQVLGASSLLFVGTYPLMKRFTHLPQAYLGMTINWGAMLGWAAVNGSCDWSVVLPLYVGCISWTMVYDTIYAHQDKKDDQDVGIKSTALLFGDNTPLWLSGFTATAVGGLAAAGYAAGIGWPYYAAVAATGAHLCWQVHTVDMNNPKDCGDKFRSNITAGAIPFLGIVAGNLV
mmetsp:Transcript_25236/g.47702  ORF Transcript_25236/g.47702 Transcript_25236/m.47702 type:complete len:432 (+) Transcript_25236:199-1494(+)|eukprot:CAMPEP_0114228344 /NCGR_PEP_ID=MMETSP0058-20121206/2289_1 /TAXON_ID=36894 /ORGANISM="Pyramimonas parkeae, CCMP726" /LENGTH=431 /DNA_ID=CAMNT_0001339277 /DNA_START=122 /DNA_END=1417 /DNA_ORIENTATION=+